MKNNATKIAAAILAGIVSTFIGHTIAFGCAEGICGELLKMSGPAGNFVYAAGEGLFSTIAIVGILVALGRSSPVLLASAGWAAFVTFVIALPALGVLLKTENIHFALVLGNLGLLTGMFLAVFFKSEMRALIEKRHPL